MNENQKPVNENYRNNYDNIFKKKAEREQRERQERESND